jgi:hypothetical protein
MYDGSFESNSGGSSATVQMGLTTDWNFNVTGSITSTGGGPVCFSNLTVATPLANSFGPSMASGDVIQAFGSDSSGNVVAFIASNTDANEQPLPDGGLYVTYVGVAGACTGVSGTDVPFRKVVARRWPVPPRPIGPRPPIQPRHAPVWRFHNSPAHQLMRQPGHPVIRPNIGPESGPGKLPEMHPELRP